MNTQRRPVAVFARSSARPLTLALAASLSLVLTACSWIQATPGDHAAYRQTRVAPSFPERVSAAKHYLDEYPEGAYAAEVGRYFKRAEPLYFESRRNSEAGLLEYLRMVPEGPRSKEASALLVALVERRQDPLLRAAVMTRERLDAARAQREQARQLLEAWLDASLDPKLFQGPLRDAPAAFLVRFSLSLPAPACEEGSEEQRLCRKDQSQVFALPTPRGLEERELTFLVELSQDGATTPRSVSLLGPEMFARLDETYSLTERRQENVRDSIEASARAVDFVSAAFERKVSLEPSCARSVTAPMILDLSCHGVRVFVRAALDENGVDEIVIEPAPIAAPSASPGADGSAPKTPPR